MTHQVVNSLATGIALSALTFGCATNKYAEGSARLTYPQGGITLEELGATVDMGYAKNWQTKYLGCPKTSSAKLTFTKDGDYTLSIAKYTYVSIAGAQIVPSDQPIVKEPPFSVRGGVPKVFSYSGESWSEVDGGTVTITYGHDGVVKTVNFDF